MVCACRYPACQSNCCEKKRFPPRRCPHLQITGGFVDPRAASIPIPQPERRMQPKTAARAPNPVLATSVYESYCLRELNHWLASHALWCHSKSALVFIHLTVAYKKFNWTGMFNLCGPLRGWKKGHLNFFCPYLLYTRNIHCCISLKFLSRIYILFIE